MRTSDGQVVGPLGEPTLELIALGNGIRSESPESERETLLAEQLRKAPTGDVGVGGRAYGLVQSPQHAVRLVNDVDRRDLHCRGSSQSYDCVGKRTSIRNTVCDVSGEERPQHQPIGAAENAGEGAALDDSRIRSGQVIVQPFDQVQA